MATIIYLDVEDEITSAATRIRTAEGRRVALVLPFGSRLATSRINFRLLAREALVNGRRLDIIAPDASARALAASAGLPVFGSVGEYESALEEPAPPDGPQGATVVAASAAVTSVAGGPRPRGSTGRREPAVEDTARLPASPAPVMPVERASDEPRVVRLPRRRPGIAAAIGLGVLVLAVVVAGAAAFVFLPTAQITVTPRIESVGPMALTVRADPGVTAVDTDAGVIPASTLEVPVEASGEFPATGKRVERTTATGGVRWTNCDPTASYTIPKGTVVKTRDGVEFATEEAVFLPVAEITDGLDLRCQTSEVAVTAVRAGPTGNVAADAIRIVPAKYNRKVIRVTNPAATTGGARVDFTRVSEEDVAAAMEQLTVELGAQFEAAVADGAGAPPGTTVFPGTATLGEPVPTPDPATLVGQEVDSFTLALSATGRVLAVDASPVEAIAARRLEASVKPGYSLVDGSTSVEVGEGTVADGVVSFEANGVAQQVRPLDPEALRAEVLGLGEEDAVALLGRYGDVELVLWPDWVSGVPSLAQRVTVVVGDPVPAGDGSGGEPVPSG